MELPRVHDRPRETGQPPPDATRAPDARPPGSAPADGHRRHDPAAKPGDQPPPNPVTGDTPALPPRPPSRPDLRRQRLADRLKQADDPVTSQTELRERLTNLEPGHPSSPWEEDGTPRPPAPRLADLERVYPPLSDAAYAAHREDVTKKLREAYGTHAVLKDQQTINPDKDIWSDDRIMRQDEIIRELYESATHVPCERKAIIAGGLGGAGKTTVLADHAGVDLSKYFTINPDKCKEELARHNMLPDIDGLSPMEASSLGHEESSYIARRLALLAYAEGKNVIWDITMSRATSGTSRINELRTAGYEHVAGIFVDIPIETSVARSEARHRRGHDLYLGGEGLGGRYVPAELIRSQADPQYGSINRRAFEEAKPLLDRWTIYDNSVDGRPAVIVEQSFHESDSLGPESK